MKNNTNLIAWALFALFLVFLPAVAIAADTAPDAQPAYTEIVEMLAPVVALVVTALLRYAARVPAYLLPVVAAVAGAGYALITSKLGSAGDMNLVQGALLGLAATGLHQIKVQLSKGNEPTPAG